MKWKPYLAYKASGVEWLGTVPEKWDVRRLKSITRFAYGDSLASEDRVQGQFEVLGSNGIVGSHEKCNTIGPCLIIGRKGSFGKVTYSERPCFAIDTTYFIDETQTKSNLRWLYYCLLWLRLDAFSKDSAVPGLARDDAYENPVPFCQEDEQRAIAAFLDRETERIDNLIAKKQRQIELLQEKRAALISHVVTKGLDPNARMKDSGVEWLGEIPEHWEINRAKAVFKQIDERSSAGEEELLTVSHITGVTPRSEKTVNMFMAESLEGYKKCQPGDLVVNTMWAWMGAMGITLRAGIVSPSYNVYRFRTCNCEPPFYDHLVRTGKFISEVTRHSQGVWTSRLRLYPEEFFEVRIPCPPLPEQREIVNFIQRETGNYNLLKNKIERSVETLREYRTALISAAVTGKIDVREGVST
ncbi:MAG: restriction endonuclease subunit S [Chloroflexi bacterium]|nr:restriction endonuclease subunit S [Chloroflexota bacterium]